VATPSWISSFVPGLEAELGLALMFASMIPIYWRASSHRHEHRSACGLSRAWSAAGHRAWSGAGHAVPVACDLASELGLSQLASRLAMDRILVLYLVLVLFISLVLIWLATCAIDYCM
jgi:hypothetical protein